AVRGVRAVAARAGGSRAEPLGSLGAFLATWPRPEHSWQHESDAAQRPGGFALQRVLDAVIFLEHLRRDRRASFAECNLEIGHRNLRGLKPAAERGEARAPHEVLEIGAGEALGPPGKRFEIYVIGQRH